MHRRVDAALLDAGTHDALDARYWPEARATLLLPSVWLADEALETFGGRGAPRGLTRRRRGRTERLFLWHPAVADRLGSLGGSRGPRLFAAVTSSSRTLLCWPAEGDAIEPFFAKLSVPLELAGAPRTITAHHARRWTDVDALVRRLPSRLRFVSEPLGLVPRAAPDLGLVVRAVPLGRWRPFFAFTHPRAAPMSERAAKRLLSQVVDVWLHAAVELGLGLELHAQNLLVEVDGSAWPTGKFAFRDLDGVTADACFLERRWPRLGPLLERIRGHRAGVFDDVDEALLDGFYRFFLGGPAAGVGERLGSRRRGQTLALDVLSHRLGVNATKPEEVRAEVHRRRALALRPPRPPRPVARFLSREHGPNERTRDPRFFAPVSLAPLPTPYQPGPRTVFALDALELSDAEVERLGADGAGLQRVVRDGVTRWRLFVHPFMRGRLGVLEATAPLRPTPFFAAPTSSPRSLMVWDRRGRAFGLKVSLDVELLGLSRLVHTSKLRRALAVDACFSAIPATTKRRLGFDVLREPAALNVLERGDGQLVRTLPPFLGDLVPGFGLFAPGGFFDRQPSEGLPRLLADLVFRPLARLSAFLFFEEGLVGQLHQQNVLFRCDARGVPDGRLVLRDLDAFDLDTRVRRFRGRPLEPLALGSAAELHLEDAVHGYDDAWAVSCRADFAFLAERLLRRKGFGDDRLAGLVFQPLDVEFLFAARTHLGEELIRAEVDWVLARARPKRRLGVAPFAVIEDLPPSAWWAGADRKRPGYSVNALVNAMLG